MLQRVHLAMAVALPVLLACAANTSGDGTQPQRSTSNVLSADELQSAGARNLYEAIERLRPRWLQVRGMRSFNTETDIVVYQERTYLGTTEELRRMGTEGIYEVRYLDGTTASATLPGLGTRHVEGAIIIFMSPPDGR